jgi:Protein of unknown function (DUF2510)
MHEYSSVSASSYDPGALVAKLNEAAADGWDVVAIVPTGGDVSAFLRRGAGGQATAGAGDPTGEMDLVGATAAEEVVVEEPETVAAGEGWAGGEVAAADAALADAGAEATDGVDSAADVIDVVEVTEVPAAGAAAAGAAGEAAAAVDEPAGWAVAPDSANDAAPAAEEIPVVATGAAAAAAEPAAAEPAAAEPSPAPAPEPAPAPAPEPAPVVTTPAGWYPDPSTRYELRYWDGTQWTEHVARQGQQFTDPPVR